MSLLPEVPSSPSRVAVETLMSWLPRGAEKALEAAERDGDVLVPGVAEHRLQVAEHGAVGDRWGSNGVIADAEVVNESLEGDGGEADVDRGIAEVADDCVDGDRRDADTAAVAEGVAEDLVEGDRHGDIAIAGDVAEQPVEGDRQTECAAGSGPTEETVEADRQSECYRWVRRRRGARPRRPGG